MSKLHRILILGGTAYYILFVFLYNASVNMSYGDDVNVFLKQTLDWHYFWHRYLIWTSRLLIEIPLVFFAKHELAFRLCNMLVMLSLPVLLCKCLRMNGIKSFIVSMLCLSVYDVSYMESAGVRATFINYMWPLAALLAAQALLQAELDNPHKHKYWFFAALSLLLFACNCEQVCLIACITYPLAVIVCSLTRHKAYKIYLAYAVVALLEMIFILTCPGNTVRLHVETKSWLQAFADFDVLQKAFLGIVVTVNRYFFQCNTIIVALLGGLALVQKTQRGKVFALIPLGCTLIVFVALGLFHVQMLHADSLAKENGLGKNGPPAVYFVEEEYLQFLALAYYVKPENGGLTRDTILADMDHYVSERKMTMEKEGLSAWAHYLKYGGNAGINPSNAFDTHAYLVAKTKAANAAGDRGQNASLWTPDKIQKAFVSNNITPLEHYLFYSGAGPFEVPGETVFPVPLELRVKSVDSKQQNGTENFFYRVVRADIWPMFFSVAMCLYIVVSLYGASDTRQEFGFFLSILVIAFCSRVALGFSPMVFSAGDRTFLFLDFSILVVCAVLIRRLREPGLCLLALGSMVHTTQQLLRLYG